MSNQATFRIFLPSVALENRSCLLFGQRNDSQHVCHVTNYLPMLVEEYDVSDGDSRSMNVVGLYVNTLYGDDPERLEQWSQFVRLFPYSFTLTRVDGELPLCTLHNSSITKNVFPIVVLYDAHDIHTTCMLETHDPHTNLGALYQSWQSGVALARQDRRVKLFVRDDQSLVERGVSWIGQNVTRACILLTSLVLWFTHTRPVEYCARSEHLPKPAVLHQLYSKVWDVHQAATLSMKPKQSRSHQLRWLNVLWRGGGDVTLGVLVMSCLTQYSDLLADTLISHTESVARGLEMLLRWMMGVPAGLKLNHELAHCLGHFFLYHIYLWKGYLSFLVPLWYRGVEYVGWSGCLGLSVQLSLVQDLISIITLHCYCFYVYAARLYSLQVYALQSLWRLFRGKKWNPLFQRVDSCSYDVDQLFIGTILFTILLFLLPTTALFYTVFTALRLLVLMVQGLLYQLVNFLHSFHVYAIYLKLLAPAKITGEMRLSVIPQTSSEQLYHHIQLLPVSWVRLFQEMHIPSSTELDAVSWGQFIHKVLSGKLVYPWIQTAN